jgi:hypothetical protein
MFVTSVSGRDAANRESVLRPLRELFDVRIAVAAEVDDLAAGDLDEVADAAGGHCFADEIAVGVFAALAAADGGGHFVGLEFEAGWVCVVRRGDDVRFATGEIVGDFLPAVVAVIPLDTDCREAGDDLREGDLGGERGADGGFDRGDGLRVHLLREY